MNALKQEHSATKIRGTILIARLAFVDARGGAQARERILKSLSAEDQTILRGRLWEGGMYPLDLNQRLDAAIARTLSPDNPDKIFVEMGRSSAETNLAGPQKALLTPGDPHRFLAQAPYLYMLYYVKGRRTYERLGPNKGVPQDLRRRPHVGDRLPHSRRMVRASSATLRRDGRPHHRTPLPFVGSRVLRVHLRVGPDTEVSPVFVRPGEAAM